MYVRNRVEVPSGNEAAWSRRSCCSGGSAGGWPHGDVGRGCPGVRAGGHHHPSEQIYVITAGGAGCWWTGGGGRWGRATWSTCLGTENVSQTALVYVSAATPVLDAEAAYDHGQLGPER
jgi:hypothetical protein